MSILQETDPRFISLEKKVGLFVLAATVAVAAVVAFAAARQGLFVPETRLTFSSDSAKELREGMAVKFSGFRIGKVTKLTLSAWANVDGSMSINKRYMKWIRADSRALLVQEGLLGETIIEITPGSPMEQELKENDSIPFERRAGLNEMLGELDTIKGLLTDLRQGAIKETLQNVNHLSEELLATRQHVDTFLDSAERTVARMDGLIDQSTRTVDKTDRAVARFDGLVDSMHETTGNVDGLLSTVHERTDQVGGLVTKLEQDLPRLVTKSDRVLDNLERATDDMALVAERTPALAEKGEQLLDKSGEVVDAVQEIWPIRKHIRKSRQRKPPVGSEK